MRRIQGTVYRRRAYFCAVCADRANIALHVGTGGNYREIWVCFKHDTSPGEPVRVPVRTDKQTGGRE